MIKEGPQNFVASCTSANYAWDATVLTLFPEMFPGSLGLSLAGKALNNGIWSIDAVDIRDFTNDDHHGIDDTPFGGGGGMIMRADIIDNALRSIKKTKELPVIYLTPRGKPLDQVRVKELATSAGVVLLCGRYEGVDNRVIDAWDMEEISIGDFVLSGGEVAALTLIDACVRLLPGVTGNAEVQVEESFENGLLEYPHYTRPQEWKGRRVPEVLLSGHHEKVKTWRQAQAEKITAERRPDLWNIYNVKENPEFNKQ